MRLRSKKVLYAIRRSNLLFLWFFTSTFTRTTIKIHGDPNLPRLLEIKCVWLVGTVTTYIHDSIKPWTLNISSTIDTNHDSQKLVNNVWVLFHNMIEQAFSFYITPLSGNILNMLMKSPHAPKSPWSILNITYIVVVFIPKFYEDQLLFLGFVHFKCHGKCIFLVSPIACIWREIGGTRYKYGRTTYISKSLKDKVNFLAHF
jgi:hypothetical protein